MANARVPNEILVLAAGGSDTFQAFEAIVRLARLRRVYGNSSSGTTMSGSFSYDPNKVSGGAINRARDEAARHYRLVSPDVVPDRPNTEAAQLARIENLAAGLVRAWRSQPDLYSGIGDIEDVLAMGAAPLDPLKPPGDRQPRGQRTNEVTDGPQEWFGEVRPSRFPAGHIALVTPDDAEYLEVRREAVRVGRDVTSVAVRGAEQLGWDVGPNGLKFKHEHLRVLVIGTITKHSAELAAYIDAYPNKAGRLSKALERGGITGEVSRVAPKVSQAIASALSRGVSH